MAKRPMLAHSVESKIEDKMAKKSFMWKMSTALIITCSLLSLGSCGENCSIPERWNGHWFINEFANVRPIIINSTANSISRQIPDEELRLGQCVWNKDDFYIFRNDLGCVKCVIINEKAENVLFSREGEFSCQNEDKDDHYSKAVELCQGQDSDVPHFYWFKQNYQPIDCPFQDTSLTFSYIRHSGTGGGKKCEKPESQLSSCISNTSIELRYEACHDTANSIGKVERLTCVGNWEESGYKYFVADVNDTSNRGSRSLKERFRCFIYDEKTVHNVAAGKPPIITGYDIGTSDSASCSGLHDPNDAETTLYLKTRSDDSNDFDEMSCSFPSWLAEHKWMDMEKSVEFVLHSEKIKNRYIHVRPTKRHYHNAPNTEANKKRKAIFFPLSHSTLACMKKVNASGSKKDNFHESHVMILAQYSIGCKVEPICLHIIQRTEYVFQLYYFEMSRISSRSLFEKCFNASTENLQRGATMVSTHGTRKACPNPGKYVPRQMVNSGYFAVPKKSYVDVPHDDDEWSIGCDSPKDLQTLPNHVVANHFSCLDTWEEEDNSSLAVVSSTLHSDFSNLYCMKTHQISVAGHPHVEVVRLTSQDCIHISDNHTLKNNDIEYDDQSNVSLAVVLHKTAYCNSTSVDGGVDKSGEEFSQHGSHHGRETVGFNGSDSSSTDVTKLIPMYYMIVRVLTRIILK